MIEEDDSATKNKERKIKNKMQKENAVLVRPTTS